MFISFRESLKVQESEGNDTIQFYKKGTGNKAAKYKKAQAHTIKGTTHDRVPVKKKTVTQIQLVFVV